ncbi:MAG: EamA family transporter [Planctomycetes bacterium]|nr:EamA family transporter [Planctomycetota bacterium]
MGVVFVVSAAVLWSLNGVLIKVIHDAGRGPGGVTIAFYRSLFAGLFLIPLARGKFHTLRREHPILRERESEGVASCEKTVPDPSPDKGRGTPRSSLPPLAARTDEGPRPRWAGFPVSAACGFAIVFFALQTVFFVVATTKTEAANAIILQYTSTFWIFAFSGLLLGERACTRDFYVLGVAMIGVVIIFVGNAATDLFGLLNALGAGLTYGLLTLMLRRIRTSDAAAVTVMNNLGSAALILPGVLLLGGIGISLGTGFWLVLLGVVQFGFPYYLFSRGLASVPAHQAGLITLIEPVLVPIWTYLVLGEQVPQTTALGGGIILAALVLFLWMKR